MTIALAIASAVATAVAPTTVVAREAPTTASAAPVSRGWAHVAVDTSQIGEAGPVLRRRVQERADVVLRRAGVMPGRGPQDPTISVIIREVGGDEPGWEYVITVARMDQTVPTGVAEPCELCTETELVDAIEGRLATLAAELEDTADTEPVATETPTETTTPITDTRPPSRGLGTKGNAGAALVAVGGAGLVAGIVLAVMPARPKSGDPTREVFTQPPGYALLGVGAALLVAGAVLLAVDRKAARKGKQARIRVAHGLGFAF